MHMPPLETERLIIRPFRMDDLDAIHHILDEQLGYTVTDATGSEAYTERKQWLQWSVLNYDALAKLYQPPYGDRAVVLKERDIVIGACGFAQALMPFEQLPTFQSSADGAAPARTTSEMGLCWAISSTYQRQGYAAEAARALIDYAFTHLNLKRIVATTEYQNAASQGVMRKLGMRIDRNPYPDPPWLQVVGVLENRAS